MPDEQPDPLAKLVHDLRSPLTVAEGFTAEQIGDQITVSVETVRTHVRNVIRKLQARNRVHAIAIALERGEIQLESPSDGG